jgi:DNA polymerase-3 subunit gamma/tau
MISAVNALEPTFRKSGQQQLLIEMLLVRMALLDRTVALEELLRGLGGESAPSGERSEPTSRGSVKTQSPQNTVARTAQRPATRPGYPPQLSAPNYPVAEAASKASTHTPEDSQPVKAPTPAQNDPQSGRASAPPQNESQLREMKRAMEATAQDSNRSRMTPEALKEERIGMLRQRDPALGTAIDELDLELLD